MALLSGKPMVQWVYERVSQANGFDEVIVATDHPDIFDTVKAFGGAVEMTAEHHPSGTDRVWEVAKTRKNAQFIFNVQGDEPLVNPHYLDEAIMGLTLHHENADIITLMAPIHDVAEIENPSVVKVVTSGSNEALYFSRAAIPYARPPVEVEARMNHSFRHIGIYGFRRSALEKFVQLPVSPLEALEKLEQLRALEAGMRIVVLSVPEAPIGVDTPADLSKIQATIDLEYHV